VTIHPSESQIEMAICHLLRIKRFHCPNGVGPPPANIAGLYWKNPAAGYFNPRKQKFVKHLSPYVGQGVSDIILVYKGVFFGWEIKRHDGKQTPNQIDFEKSLILAGGKYYVLKTIDDAEKALEEITKDSS